jgi:hypothetical protein
MQSLIVGMDRLGAASFAGVSGSTDFLNGNDFHQALWRSAVECMEEYLQGMTRTPHSPSIEERKVFLRQWLISLDVALHEELAANSFATPDTLNRGDPKC